MPARTIKMASIGGGMFGRDVVLRKLADVERCGIAPYLGTAGLDHHARDFHEVEFKLVAIGVRREEAATALVQDYGNWAPGAKPKPYYSETSWIDILDEQKPDVLFVATPDSLHTAPIMAALERGVHVVTEKPLTLMTDEARTIVDKSREAGLIVGVDMHKRYDAFLRGAFVDLVPQLGNPLYGRAVLEEPLEVSTEIFKWAATSNPFSYVGVHWTDLFAHYLGIKPVSLHAVGQKKLLANWKNESNPDGIDTFDSMQVTVQYDNGMSVQYVNAWINPADFEGPVNQEMEIVGTNGRVFVDQQDRGMRSCITKNGMRTHNPHFQAEVPRMDSSKTNDSACIGYCGDSLIAGLDAAARVRLGLTTQQELKGTYPDAESSLPTVALLEAAEQVAQANLDYLNDGKGVPVSARFDGRYNFEILDPLS
jgi:predicted dehydrogenase